MAKYNAFTELVKIKQQLNDIVAERERKVVICQSVDGFCRTHERPIEECEAEFRHNDHKVIMYTVIRNDVP